MLNSYYSDVLCGKLYNNTFYQKMESKQHALAIIGTIRGSFWKQYYLELGWETLQQQR